MIPIEDEAILSELSRLYINEQSVTRLMLILRTRGCSYARRSGGCSHCSLIQHANKNVTADHLKNQFISEIQKYQDREYHHLDLFTLGSFFDPEEIPREFSQYVFRYISEREKVYSVTIESRPEYITKDKLEEYTRLLGPVNLEVALGIESTNEYIRGTLIKKGFTLGDVEGALDKISQFRHVRLLGYVLVKPVGLSEIEAIEDAVSTINDIFALGNRYHIPTRVAVQPVYIAKNSETFRKYVKGEYRLLKLWSIIEILKRTNSLGDISVGLNDEGLSDGLVVSSCPLCNPKVMDELRKYNGTNDLNALLQLDCTCKKDWGIICTSKR